MNKDKLWQAILERDNHRCIYCGSTEDLQMDHIIPVSKGGRDTITNVAVACATCNHKKFNKTVEEVGFTLPSYLDPNMRESPDTIEFGMCQYCSTPYCRIYIDIFPVLGYRLQKMAKTSGKDEVVWLQGYLNRLLCEDLQLLEYPRSNR